MKSVGQLREIGADVDVELLRQQTIGRDAQHGEQHARAERTKGRWQNRQRWRR